MFFWKWSNLYKAEHLTAEAGVYNITSTIDSGYALKKYKHLNWENEYECYNFCHDYLKVSEWINT